jgi:hypothetical protein
MVIKHGLSSTYVHVYLQNRKCDIGFSKINIHKIYYQHIIELFTKVSQPRFGEFQLCVFLPEASIKTRSVKLLCQVQGCQIFLDTMYQNVIKDTKLPQHYQMALNIPNDRKLFQMTIKYTSIFQSKALQNLPKLGFLV